MDNFDLEIFKKVIDALPYPVWIHAFDGMTLYQNKACYDYYLYSPKDIIGVYNFLEDPTVDEMVSIKQLRRVQQGETVFFPSVKLPLDIVQERWKVKYNFEALYLDITVYPIIENGKVQNLVTLQIPCRMYKGKSEIERAKEYIENNWYEKYNLTETVKASGLSRAYFTRQFKKATGMTAQEYYLDIKVKKLKEKLTDPSLSVTQAFSACNLDYNGHYAKMFKEKAGLTPTEFKNTK